MHSICPVSICRTHLYPQNLSRTTSVGIANIHINASLLTNCSWSLRNAFGLAIKAADVPMLHCRSHQSSLPNAVNCCHH
jgi:hypothetical protein